MGVLHDPLADKVKSVAERLNRRRQRLSDLSKSIAEKRTAYFDRLALLNAGALTFSTSLLALFGTAHAHWVALLHISWGLLLMALGGCLIRNLAQQHFELADAFKNRAEAELDYLGLDDEVITTRTVVYSDSTEPFDRDREISVNESNRSVWSKHREESTSESERYWIWLKSCEWVAGVAMFLGYLFLIMFAALNA